MFVPATAALQPDEAIRVLTRANEAKEYQYSELSITWHNGQISANRIHIKQDGPTRGGIRVGSAPRTSAPAAKEF